MNRLDSLTLTRLDSTRLDIMEFKAMTSHCRLIPDPFVCSTRRSVTSACHNAFTPHYRKRRTPSAHNLSVHFGEPAGEVVEYRSLDRNSMRAQ
jgi:hypothetical protein